MAWSPPTVVIREQPDQPTDWRKFVAILCFIEFYSQFVLHGQGVSLFLRPPREALNDEAFYVVLHGGLAMMRAVMLYGYGRALWFNKPSACRWLLRAIVVSLSMSAVVIVDVCFGSPPRPLHYIDWMSQSGFSSTNSRATAALLRNADHLPWLLALLTGAWSVRHHRGPGASRVKPWVFIAAAWCLGIIPLPFWQSLETTGRLFPLSWWLSIYSLPISALLPAYGLVPLVVGVLLVLTRKIARTLALLPVVTDLVVILLSTYRLNLYCWAAIEAMLLNVEQKAPFWTIFLLNQQTFQWLFAEFPATVGPWLLIAFYTWRVPMRWPAEDGSPHPRRYCGRCGYNLHGVTSDCCPECGTVSGRRPDLNVEPVGALSASEGGKAR
jgi:hypothetical protein